jgi:hypothetical protein
MIAIYGWAGIVLTVGPPQVQIAPYHRLGKGALTQDT